MCTRRIETEEKCPECGADLDVHTEHQFTFKDCTNPERDHHEAG